MGCLLSKDTEASTFEAYSVPRERAYSEPKCNDNKLLKLKEISGSLEMEAELLENLNKRMPRYSTADQDLSELKPADFIGPCKYSEFKMDLVTYRPLQLQFVAGIPEAIAGQTTPEGFPGFTVNYSTSKKQPVYAVIRRSMKRKRRRQVTEIDIKSEREINRVQLRVFDLPDKHKVKDIASPER
ncbi:unnamed protein product [Hermetia illucens]|uniref:Uncharacterized protein n=1 Tax=Hermetia illucens TaxID=343691 RepID=A0A7R8UG56_HERIL|nr:unnamed protein product [Hermetia illucens]